MEFGVVFSHLLGLTELELMPPSGTSSQFHKPAEDGSTSSSDDQSNTGDSVWKHRYLVLQERLNSQTASKRTRE